MFSAEFAQIVSAYLCLAAAFVCLWVSHCLSVSAFACVSLCLSVCLSVSACLCRLFQHSPVLQRVRHRRPCHQSVSGQLRQAQSKLLTAIPMWMRIDCYYSPCMKKRRQQRKRERERERDRGTETYAQRDTETDMQQWSVRALLRDRARARESERERDNHGQRHPCCMSPAWLT